jgi:single-strand DNA-binding protein
MNDVFLTNARLTKAPDFYAYHENAKAILQVAVSREHDREKADFPIIEIWNKTAEFCADNLDKGDVINIRGEIRTEKYEQNGETKYRTFVLANRIEPVRVKKFMNREDSGSKAPDQESVPEAHPESSKTKKNTKKK